MTEEQAREIRQHLGHIYGIVRSMWFLLLGILIALLILVGRS